MLIGYGRVSTRGQDTETQIAQLEALGIPTERIYLDKASGKNTDRPGLQTALAVLREGDTLTVTKLDRLARSLPDALDLGRIIAEKGARLSFAGQVYDPRDPMGKLLFAVLAMVAEFERDLNSQRTRDGLATAKRHGRIGGRPPKLSPDREKLLVKLVASDQHTQREAATLFGVSHSTVQRALRRAGV